MSNLILALGILCAAQPAENLTLDGTWKIVRTEMDGEASDGFVGRTMEISGTKLIFHVTDSRSIERTLHFDTSVSPYHFDQRSKDGKQSLGIAKLDGKRLIICRADPGGSRPHDFKTRKGDVRLLYVLERVK